jgi:hypothetical protein
VEGILIKPILRRYWLSLLLLLLVALVLLWTISAYHQLRLDLQPLLNQILLPVFTLVAKG